MSVLVVRYSLNYLKMHDLALIWFRNISKYKDANYDQPCMHLPALLHLHMLFTLFRSVLDVHYSLDFNAENARSGTYLNGNYQQI